MLATSPKYLGLPIILFTLLLLFYFRGDVSQLPLRDTVSRHAKSWSQTVLHPNATSFEHDGTFDELSEGAPRVACVSMQFGGNFNLMTERGLRTHIGNGEKWGYPTHYLRQDIVGRGELEKGVYDKLLYLLTVMVNEMTKPFGKRAEWIVWFDSDSVLINNNIPWTLFLPPGDQFREINLLVTKDWSGLNAGVFLIRVCEWGVNILSDAIALPRLKPEVELLFREQSAIEYMMDMDDNKKHRLYQPRHWFNVYDEEHYRDHGERIMSGSFLIHFPGMGGARDDAMGKWLEKLSKTPEQLQVPLENTTYPQEIDAYWSRLRSANDAFKKSEEFKEGARDEHNDVYEADPRIQKIINEAEDELADVVYEDPYGDDRMKDAVEKLQGAIKIANNHIMHAEKEKVEAEAAQAKAEEKNQALQRARTEQEQQETSSTGFHTNEEFNQSLDNEDDKEGKDSIKHSN